MNNYLLECQNINKFYQEGENQTQVLKGVSFAMKPQELVEPCGFSIYIFILLGRGLSMFPYML